MATRRILIVDDSRTAQVRLRKMLEVYDAEIDTVGSAEEALGYLSYKQPDIIFLDHHMEGMDGLAALKIIKSNPSTALIPVVMYTSEQGDVYVGQARALGALDIISKDVVKAANLATLMANLNIDKKGEQKPAIEPEIKKPTPASSEITNDDEADKIAMERAVKSRGDRRSPELEQVQAQVSKLFEIHIAKVRQEIEDSTKFITRRLSRDIQEQSVKNDKPVAEEKPAEEYYEPPPPPVESSTASFLLWLLMAAALSFTGFHLYLNNKQYDILVSKYSQLSDQYKNQQGQMVSVIKKLADRPAVQNNESNERVLFDALGWAVNVDSNTPFGEQALGDHRIYMLGELLSLLTAANFNGTVFLDIHAGNYCVVEGPSGQLILPEPESNLEDCIFMSDRNDDITLQSDISIGFLNYINSTPILTEGKIQLEMSSLGFSSPKYSYPPITNATSAGQWNEAARRNNRLAFSFVPD